MDAWGARGAAARTPGGGGWGGAAPPDQRGSENGQTPRPSGQPPADKGPANPAAARNEDQQPPNAGGAPGGGRGSEGKFDRCLRARLRAKDGQIVNFEHPVHGHKSARISKS